MGDRVEIYDTTLRDGGQAQGVDFGATDKIAVARALDDLGVDYIEAGWPGANPTDDAVFASLPRFRRARAVAFGMTRRPGRSAANDPGLAAVLAAGAPTICLVGKTWDFHVRTALGVDETENRTMIADSIAHAAGRAEQVLFDAEHFFDGYKANPDFALSCIAAALEAGADRAVLCDTNGGTLPHEIGEIVSTVLARLPGRIRSGSTATTIPAPPSPARWPRSPQAHLMCRVRLTGSANAAATPTSLR